MSNIVNYQITADSYDNLRKPLAVKMVLNQIKAHTGKKINELQVLDGGCGSGQYAEAFLQEGVGAVTMFDASPAMLANAEKRVLSFKEDGKVPQIVEHRLPTIPYPDESFDAVMFNQVLHHIDPLKTTDNNNADTERNYRPEDFPNVKKALQEAYRVLRKPGLLVIDCCLPNQTMKGFWYSNLAIEGAKRYASRYAALPVFLEFTKAATFSEVNSYALLDDLFMNPKYYNNTSGPLDENWRCCDSFFGSLSDKEIKEAEAKLSQMRSEGTLQKKFEQWERERLGTGQTTKICAKK